jgi:signal transduction histidine kinase
LRIKTFPLLDGEGGLIGFIQAAKSVEDSNAALQTLLLVMTGSGLLGLLLFAAGGYLVSGRVIRPVQEGYERQRQFVADASHELRTPLTVIRTNSGMLLQRRQHDPAIEDIDVEARYMSQLLDNLLSLANGDRRLLKVEASPLPLSEVARSAGRSLHPRAEASGLSLREELDAGIVVMADADVVRQVIFILLDNAIKFTPAGGEVVLTSRRSGQDGIVEVRDTGIGMTADELAHASDRFFRGDQARSRSHGGAGLGLSIAQELIAALNGRLELESEPGKGTTARIRLRLAYAPESEQPAARARRPAARLN